MLLSLLLLYIYYCHDEKHEVCPPCVKETTFHTRKARNFHHVQKKSAPIS